MQQIREFNRSLDVPLGGYATKEQIMADARRSCQKKPTREQAIADVTREYTRQLSALTEAVKKRTAELDDMKKRVDKLSPGRESEQEVIGRIVNVKDGIITGSEGYLPRATGPGPAREFYVPSDRAKGIFGRL